MITIPEDFLKVALQAAGDTGADVLLLAAISMHETHFGTLGAGIQGYELGYGVYSETNLDPRFKGLYNQLHYAGKQITGYLGAIATGGTTWEQLLAFSLNSWKAADKGWALSVWYWYQQIKEGYKPVNIIYCYGPDDMVWALRIANKVSGVIAPREMLGRITTGNVYIVGGEPVEGATANITGADFLETSEKAISFLRA